MSPLSDGFARRTNRRGVTPFVTFVNLSGQYVEKSGSTFSASSCDCSAATPLTLVAATVARYAIRTERSGDSVTIDIRRARSSSSGNLSRTSARKLSLIL